MARSRAAAPVGVPAAPAIGGSRTLAELEALAHAAAGVPMPPQPVPPQPAPQDPAPADPADSVAQEDEA